MFMNGCLGVFMISKNKQKYIFIGLALLILVTVVTTLVKSQACCQISYGSTANYMCYHGLNRHIVHFVSEPSSLAIFAPTGSYNEWHSFLTSGLSGLTIYDIDCCTDTQCPFDKPKCLSRVCNECVISTDCSFKCASTFWAENCYECIDNECFFAPNFMECSTYCDITT